MPLDRVAIKVLIDNFVNVTVSYVEPLWFLTLLSFVTFFFQNFDSPFILYFAINTVFIPSSLLFKISLVSSNISKILSFSFLIASILRFHIS